MPLLDVDTVSIRFGGVQALDRLSFDIDSGSICGLIGPNGAGKTTMMDVITGKTRPDEGSAFFGQSIDLTRLTEPEIAHAGIGRKFQKPTVFETLTVFENLELALAGSRSSLAALFAELSGEQRDRIGQVLSTIRLQDRAGEKAGALSHGQKQWLEIGMLLAQNPRLMMLDEPVAGMTDAETDQTAELLLEINKERSVIVVEHDMAFVRDLGVKVTVLHEGSVLAEGSLDHVSADPRVVEVYLGR